MKITNIKMNYGKEEILDNINYRFREGLIYGLIGKNGAGKTTLLKIIMRLIRKNDGDIYINDKKVNEDDYLNIRAIFIGDSPIFFNDLTVMEQLLLVSKVQKIKKDEAFKKINSILEKLKLIKYKNHYPTTLSKGTLQRFNIALGMIRNENIILMDEPFNALDPVQVKSVEDLILEYKKNNKTFLISSHDIDSLRSICDIYLILKDGKLLEFKPSELNKENITKLIGESYGE